EPRRRTLSLHGYTSLSRGEKEPGGAYATLIRSRLVIAFFLPATCPSCTIGEAPYVPYRTDGTVNSAADSTFVHGNSHDHGKPLDRATRRARRPPPSRQGWT